MRPRKSITNTAQLNIKIAPALKKAAEEAAAADFRSLTSLIERLLHDYVRHQRRSEKSPDARHDQSFAIYRHRYSPDN
jgi:hypothetical protein